MVAGIDRSKRRGRLRVYSSRDVDLGGYTPAREENRSSGYRAGLDRRYRPSWNLRHGGYLTHVLVPLIIAWCWTTLPCATVALDNSNSTTNSFTNSSTCCLNSTACEIEEALCDDCDICENDDSNTTGPINCTAAGFPFAKSLVVSQTTSAQSADNEIRLEFSFTAPIVVSSFISVMGLRGSDTHGSILQVRPGVGGQLVLSANATWNHTKGLLVLQAGRTILSNESIVATLTLRNPARANPGQTVTVVCPDCATDERHARANPGPAPGDLPDNAPLRSLVSECEANNITDAAHPVLGVTYVAPACAASSPSPPYQPLFGPSCTQTCFGTTIGHRCVCGKLQKGPDCGMTLVVAAAAATRIVPGEAGAVSIAIPGLPAFSAVSLPAGALGAAITVEVQALEFAEFEVAASDTSKGYGVAGRVMTFGPPGTRFNTDVTILLPVTRLPGQGRVNVPAWLNETSGQWEEVRVASGGAVVVDGFTFVPALTNHFSQFVVLSANAPAAAATPAPGATPSITLEPTGCGQGCVLAIAAGAVLGGLLLITLLAAAAQTVRTIFFAKPLPDSDIGFLDDSQQLSMRPWPPTRTAPPKDDHPIATSLNPAASPAFPPVYHKPVAGAPAASPARARSGPSLWEHGETGDASAPRPAAEVGWHASPIAVQELRVVSGGGGRPAVQLDAQLGQAVLARTEPPAPRPTSPPRAPPRLSPPPAVASVPTAGSGGAGAGTPPSANPAPEPVLARARPGPAIVESGQA